jgi:uridine kinase
MFRNHNIIAVSAIAGGGKSTVVRKLVELLGDAVAIHFDDYTTPETYPSDFNAWSKSGYDFNEINSPQLAQHLQALKRGEAVTSPANGMTIAPTKYILFEGPLGRANQETGQYIDFLVFIDTPLEVGLARMILRASARQEVAQMTQDNLIEQIDSITELAESYLMWTRNAYLAQLEQVKPASDLIVDGTQSIEAIATAIIDALNEAELT